jgi:hypothetical protein
VRFPAPKGERRACAVALNSRQLTAFLLVGEGIVLSPSSPNWPFKPPACWKAAASLLFFAFLHLHLAPLILHNILVFVRKVKHYILQEFNQMKKKKVKTPRLTSLSPNGNFRSIFGCVEIVWESGNLFEELTCVV